jgi:hypothetical protein
MTVLRDAFATLAGAAALAISVPAFAQGMNQPGPQPDMSRDHMDNRGMDHSDMHHDHAMNRHGHRHCHWVWRHHHRVRVCSRW